MYSKSAIFEEIKKKELKMLSNLQFIVGQNSFKTEAIFEKLIEARSLLAEVKWAAESMPNQDILISTLILQESHQSSAIENIISTEDALYKSKLNPTRADADTKEIIRYSDALKEGLKIVLSSEIINLSSVIKLQQIIRGVDEGVRVKPGTIIRNAGTGKIIYRPPEPNELENLLKEWGEFINDASVCNLDPLIKMALSHHQFESIHPFYDGNGRTGRIVNILYLVKEGLLNSPILYLSRYINQTKSEYYCLLQSVRDESKWEEWVLYMLEGICRTSESTLQVINKIKNLLQETKNTLRDKYPKMYSHELLNNLFEYPYTKIQFLQDDIRTSRNTANRYLDILAEDGILQKEKHGKENYYINFKLLEILTNIPDGNGQQGAP